MSAVLVRPLAAADEPAWRPLWIGCLDVCRKARRGAIHAATCARLASGAKGAAGGRGALGGDTALGLVHHLLHRHCWRMENVVCLQDLFAAPAAPGARFGRALRKRDCAPAPFGRVAQVTPFRKHQGPAR